MCGLVTHKEKILKILLVIFKRAVLFLFVNDEQFNKEILKLSGKCFSIKINKTDLSTAFKVEKSRIVEQPESSTCEVELIFKNLCFAFKTFSALISLEETFSYRGVILNGQIKDALALTRAIKRLQAVVFPDFWIKRAIKGFEGSKPLDRLEFLRFYLGLLKPTGRR